MTKPSSKRAEMRATITKRAVDALKPGEHIADEGVVGFVARCLPSGRVSYGYRFRTGGKRRWLALGLHGSITPEQARKLAKQAAGKVAAERDPQAEREKARAEAEKEVVGKVNAVLDEFERHHVSKLRSAEQVNGVLRRHVRPRIGKRIIYDLQRSDITAMLDEIAVQHGPVIADRVLAWLRKAFNWQMARDDRFNSPITKAMARLKPGERARDRVLSDGEIRDLWKALDEITQPEPFPRFIRALVLTALRRSEVSHMRWEEIEGDTWTLPSERSKTKRPQVVPLTEEARTLLGEPRKRGYVFSTDSGERAFSGYGKPKAVLDRKIAEIRKSDGRKPMARWTLHDLRRTARSLMSRAGVSADIAERVLGHVIPGVRGVYDRHEYAAEKRDALERLAAMIERILNPAPNVVAMPPRVG
jgi:integrase